MNTLWCISSVLFRDSVLIRDVRLWFFCWYATLKAIHAEKLGEVSDSSPHLIRGKDHFWLLEWSYQWNGPVSKPLLKQSLSLWDFSLPALPCTALHFPRFVNIWLFELTICHTCTLYLYKMGAATEPHCNRRWRTVFQRVSSFRQGFPASDFACSSSSWSCFPWSWVDGINGT